MTVRLRPPRQVTIDVRGIPRPQGSIKAFARKGGGIATTYTDNVWTWRNKITATALSLNLEQFDQSVPVELRMGFELPRPQDHYLPVNSRRSAPEVKLTAPPRPVGVPDLDKLVRAISDALTDAGVWHDDSQVCLIVAAKRYTNDVPGVRINVIEMENL